MGQSSRFQVYESQTLLLVPGDKIRISQNGFTSDGKHRLNNGAVYQLNGFTNTGDLKLTNGWVIGMDRLRLAEDINNYAEDYSRGMKKKVGLLLAILHKPKLLVLDKPTNGLDVESTHLFYDLILDEAKQGTTVLFSTHLTDHVTKLCSHAVIINEGTVVAKGSLDELCSRFDHYC